MILKTTCLRVFVAIDTSVRSVVYTMKEPPIVLIVVIDILCKVVGISIGLIIVIVVIVIRATFKGESMFSSQLCLFQQSNLTIVLVPPGKKHEVQPGRYFHRDFSVQME